MNNSFQASGLSFDILKLKYQVIKPQYCISMMGILNRRDRGTKLCVQEKNMLANSGFSTIQTQDSSSSNPLYQILNKVELGGELSQVDIDWLTKEHLFDTIEFIRKEEEKKKEEKNKKQLQIFKKVECLRTLSESEVNWLKSENLIPTLEIYQKQQLQKFARQQEIEEIKEATEEKIKASHFLQLKLNYKATKYKDSHSFSRLYPILLKLDRHEQLVASEMEWLKNNQLFDTLEIYQKRESERIAREQKAEVERIAREQKTEAERIAREQEAEAKRIAREQEAKEKIKAEKHYTIVKQLETGKRLNPQDGQWLKKHQFLETFAIFQERESLQINELSQLKDKYKASKHQDLSTSNKLYKILQKLESKQKLVQVDIHWLKKQGLTDTITIAEKIQEQKNFAALKSKYQATQYEDSSLSSPLYQILKRIDSGKQPSNAEFNWLSKHSLHQVIEVTKERELKEHFISLKVKYNVSDYKDNSPSSNLYLILQKLDKQERLEATDVAWLTENKLFYPNEKITIEYHRIEAIFYEQEFQRTKNEWNLPSASSHWRKADEAQTALKLTDDLDWDRVKDKKLKSALLTTRGGAYRDIQQLNKAENCARGAIEYQPDSHHPYTLMGAICYERGQYLEGDSWFNEAIKRGANPRDMDSEIKRVVRNAKNENKRREVVEFLLKKDPSRYAWAKAYLKKF
ncbi:hypothetical protein QUB60_04350 [Microcoleus sp. A2-C5]|uniref:hypothetical protein n=1 Tax=unclassified Microcoleus TaxID=2642155 RepID=UPI002FCEA32B